MKKAVALLLAMLMVVGMLSGCSGKAESTAEKSAEGNDDKVEVYLLIKARGDLSFWDSMAAGADRAAADFADKANVHVIETTGDIQANLTAMYEAVDKGADLIITAGDYIDNMKEVAEAYPEVGFLMVAEELHDVPNIYTIDFAVSEAGFLAGMAAADVASQGSNVIGFVGGIDEVVVIQEFFLGYIQGAKYYNPETQVIYNYVGDWGNPDKGRTQALAQYNDMNAEVIFACAGGSGNGVHQAASEVGKYVIGADADQSVSYAERPEIQKTFLTSVLKRMDNGIYNVIDTFIKDGSLPYGDYDIFGLTEESVGIVENDLYQKYVSEEGKAKINEAKAAIADGSIEVVGALGKDQATIKSEIEAALNQ